MTVALAVDVDHTLAALGPAVAKWAAETTPTTSSSDSTAAAWHARLQEPPAGDGSVFFESAAFREDVEATDAAARDALKGLRKYFTLLAITNRPRRAEKATRAWLDQHFGGVFDKLLFLDASGPEDALPRTLKLFDEFKVKVAVTSDPDMATKKSEKIDRVVLVGTVPWATEATTASVEGEPKITVLDGWSSAKDAFATIVEELGVTSIERHGSSGPKLARYSDDLVTVSSRKPPVFYVNVINSKFTVQRQETIRLQATDVAITTAVQTTELLKLQHPDIVQKISTRSTSRLMQGGYRTRVPKIEILLHKALAPLE